MFVVTTTQSGAAPRGMRRQFNNCLKATFEETGVHWQTRYRAKHFTREGGREYGYRPRSGEQSGIGTRGFFRTYTGRKLKKFGHTNPLVFTGESERQTRIANIRATFKGVRIALNAPKLSFKNPHSQIDMQEELRTISKPEEQEINQLVHTRFERRLTMIQDRDTVRL